MVVVVVVGGGVKSFSCQAQLRLSCGWVGVLTIMKSFNLYSVMNNNQIPRGGGTKVCVELEFPVFFLHCPPPMVDNGQP